ncbi:HEAT repeat domain-containing protein [Massilia sp. BSC265]|uniref:HEAT repeat domain-containing protein n=1 Tax=Massilia sp. BSC265 TaxID=1549812 RepID=UPI0004E8C038|nr:HEAT repeat domain-containing protein [Massilia sp. BSC265]KFI08406.1 hypothetical protein JN27_04425 [Massilia sp. BSC265]
MPFIRHNAAPHTAAPAEADSLAVLARRLASPDAGVRRGAAAALGTVPGAVGLLLAALDGEPEQAVRSALVDALGRIASGESVAALAECLRSEDTWLRNAAIDVLRGLPEQVAGAIAHLLADWDRDVRILAVGILDTLRHERLEEWLLQLVEADGDVNVCGAALDVLAEVASQAAHGPVTRVMERFQEEPYIAFAGKLVLERLEG